MTATDYATYKDYCNARAARGLQVLPEAFWNALKEDV